MIPLLACNVLDTFNMLLLTNVKFTVNFDEMVLIIVRFIPVEMHSLTPTPHHAPRKINLAGSEAPVLLTADRCRLDISNCRTKSTSFHLNKHHSIARSQCRVLDSLGSFASLSHRGILERHSRRRFMTPKHAIAHANLSNIP